MGGDTEMKGLILAGGHGTRLRPITYTTSKQLIPIANKPVLFYAIEALKDAGITDIGIIVGHTEERICDIQTTVGDGSTFGVKVTYIKQDAPRGIAHAVMISEKFMGDSPFVVYLGDNLLKGGIREFKDLFESSSTDALVLLTPVANPQMFGVAEMDGDRILRLVEKPKEPKSNLALVGIYFFRNSVFGVLKKLKPSWRNELEITEAVDNMVQSKDYSVAAHVVKGWWKDTGKPEDILHANHLVLDDITPQNLGQMEENVRIIGKARIGKKTIIHANSVIKGPVIIGDNCRIGPNAYIGPYTAIGDNTTIDGGEIEYSILLSDCKIDCKKRIVHSLIGKNSRVYNSSDSMPNGYKLVIGENSSVGI